MIRRLWADDCGAVISTELVLVLGVATFGVVPGIAAIRNQVNAAAAQATPFEAVLPDPDSLRAQVAIPSVGDVRSESKAASHSQAISHSGANVSIVLNVPVPSQSILPPSP